MTPRSSTLNFGLLALQPPLNSSSLESALRFCRITFHCSLLVLFFSSIALNATPSKSNFKDHSLSDLEQLQLQIQSELSALARTALSSGRGSIGQHSHYHKNPITTEWIKIDLEEDVMIDEIVLVPSIRRDNQRGFISDGFPEEFRILAGTGNQDKGEVIAEYSDTSHIRSGVLPMVIPLAKTRASWIRLEATRLSPTSLWPYDGIHALLLAEIIVFSGEDNMALRRPVSVSSYPEGNHNWSKDFLVDGNLPYLMNAAHGEGKPPMIAQFSAKSDESITIDLEQEQPISRIRIHTEDPSDTVPQTRLFSKGLPPHFKLEGSNHSSFENTKLLLDVHLASTTALAPIMEWAFSEQNCRYVRLTSIGNSSKNEQRMSFAEIELLSNGKNVAYNKESTATFKIGRGITSFSKLTDGENNYGRIIPYRKWIEELGRRHELETKLPIVNTELSRRYEHQKQVIKWVRGSVIMLILSVGGLLVYGKLLRRRQEIEIRNRIAANIHDQLGANLHAIGLLGDIAEESLNAPNRLAETVRRIRSLTEVTGAAAKHCSNMIAADGVCEDLAAEMEKDAALFLTEIDYNIHFATKDSLNQLPRRLRIHLYLFHKECLANLIRHSGAKKVSIRASVINQQVKIEIEDDGCGLQGSIPKSVQRRARFMKATVKHHQPETGGTLISLNLNTNRWNFLT